MNSAAHVRTRPNTTQDLFELYGFNDLAKSVARKQPGNPDGKSIRKTYKSVFKGLSGAFDVNTKEVGAPDTHFAMMMMPPEEWEVQMVRGKDIAKGLPPLALANMGKAFTMARGSIPKSVWNSSVLGDIVVPPAPVRPMVKPAVKPTGNAVRAPPSQPSTVPRLPQEVPRPKRSIKKRRYGDTSYEGYGDGYVDDEMQDTGYSEGDGDDRRKRPKKVCDVLHLLSCMTNNGKSTTTHANFQQAPMRQNSYGPGMVGA